MRSGAASCGKATRETRTRDLSFTKAQVPPGESIREGVSGEAGGTPSSSHSSSDENQPLDADLRRLIDAWPELPDAIRAGILAMVDAVADG